MTEISFAYTLMEDGIELSEIECEMEVDGDGEVIIKIWPLNGGLVDAPRALAKKIEDWYFKDQERCGEYQEAKSQAWRDRYYTEREDARALRVL